MRVKILYRSPVVWNLILFIFFSIAFLVLQEIYVNITTILNQELLLDFTYARLWYLGLCFLTFFSLMRLSKYSRFLVITVVLATFAYTAINLNQEFSKMILVILFFYLLIAYYLLQFLKMDMQEPFYNPGFIQERLFEPMLTKIECEIVSKKNQISKKGFLTNWSKEGCFVYLPENFKFNSSISLKIFFEDHVFTQDGFIVSRNKQDNGYGLKFIPRSKKEKSDIMGWSDFYTIIEQMGLEPELLR